MLLRRSLLGPEPRRSARASSARERARDHRSPRSACSGSAARSRPLRRALASGASPSGAGCSRSPWPGAAWAPTSAPSPRVVAGATRGGARVGGGHRLGQARSRSCSSHRSPGSPPRCSSTSRRAATRTSAARCCEPAAWTRSPTSPSAASSSATGRWAGGSIPFLVAFALVGLAVGFRYRRALLASTEDVRGSERPSMGSLRPSLVGALTNDSGPDHPADRHHLSGSSP